MEKPVDLGHFVLMLGQHIYILALAPQRKIKITMFFVAVN
jgi:hypothetical protein